GSSVFGVLIIRVIDIFFDSKILSTIWNCLTISTIFILNFFKQQFVWSLYELILLFFSGPLLGILVLSVIFKIQDSPDWLSYKKDIFNGVKYKWNYTKNFDGKYIVENLIPYCPKCECQIIDETCPNCNTFFYDKLKAEKEIKSLIIHRIDMKNNDEI
ncbi:MAG: hypothetical protein D3904_18560, partial [Candidatus Electrothrix sp. EH2]|nr:hypothetical protein [Candidatus Electrothrix sp. EH2]